LARFETRDLLILRVQLNVGFAFWDDFGLLVCSHDSEDGESSNSDYQEEFFHGFAWVFVRLIPDKSRMTKSRRTVNPE